MPRTPQRRVIRRYAGVSARQVAQRNARRAMLNDTRPFVVGVPRILKYNQPYSFSRMVNFRLSTTTGTGFTIAASSFAGVFFTFTPVDLTVWGSAVVSTTTAIPNAAEYAALWDRIKIDKVDLLFVSNGVDPTFNTAATNTPRLFIANDYTDGTTGNTLSQTQQQENCQYFTCPAGVDYAPYKHTCRPKYQRIVYYTAVTSDYEPATGFVRNGVEIPHYGVRLAMDPARCGTGAIEMAAKFYFTCDNVK